MVSSYASGKVWQPLGLLNQLLNQGNQLQLCSLRIAPSRQRLGRICFAFICSHASNCLERHHINKGYSSVCVCVCVCVYEGVHVCV